MNYMDSTMLIIGNVPQYFFDNLVVEQIQDITRTVHSPRKEPGPLIQKDRPWERIPYLTVNGWNLLRDSATGEFKCWYDDFPVDTQEVVRQKALYCVSSWTSYARSSDGLNWEKPELDHLEVEGRRTNIVIGGKPPFTKLDSTTVFEDTLDPDPERRFKMLLTRYLYAKDRSEEELATTLNLKPGFDNSHDEIRIEMHYSADGIKWTPSKELPRYGQHGNGLGDAYTFFVDADSGIYRFLTRAAGMLSVHYDERRPRTNSFFPPTFPHDVARMNKRRVFQSESVDLIHWSRPQCILTPDAQEDNLDDSYYGMVQFKRGEVYVGLVNVLHEVSNTIDVRLVYSRDGWRWYQLNQRQPWLTTSAGSWDDCMVNISSPPIPMGDESFVFYGGASCHHDWWMMGLYEGLDVPEAHNVEAARYGLGLAKMRLDGFVSVDAGAVREGVLVTKDLRTEGRQLVLNATCGNGGYVQVEATDSEERVLEGCSRAACNTFSGDSTKATITWKGRADIPHGGSLRLRFFMRDASLYSFALV
ncbi:MAG: hypothetical protein HY318_12280 [Armatimonadetes bacterium]|nr:hypothetical protein [Armatimonadota bacterium]